MTNKNSGFPSLHKRHSVVQTAKAEFGMYMIELEKKFNLTESEIFSLLAGEMSQLASSCIRSERDRESDK